MPNLKTTRLNLVACWVQRNKLTYFKYKTPGWYQPGVLYLK